MIINLTQHLATPDQIAAGVVDLPAEVRADLTRALTFVDVPSAAEIRERAEAIAELAVHNGLGGDEGDDPLPEEAMIGGAPYLMGPLERALKAVGINPVYSFSTRSSIEERQPDGAVRKTAVFRHAGFIDAVT